jgi:hypothetical protein
MTTRYEQQGYNKDRNRPNSKFCSKCRMVLRYDAYNETLENEKQKEDKLTIMEKQFNAMQSQMQSLISAFSNIKDQTQVDGMAKTLYGSGLIKEASSGPVAAETVTTSSTRDLDKEEEQQQRKKQQDQLIREAGKASYHATITKSALSTTISTAAPNKRRKMKIRIKSNLPKKVS